MEMMWHAGEDMVENECDISSLDVKSPSTVKELTGKGYSTLQYSKYGKWYGYQFFSLCWKCWQLMDYKLNEMDLLTCVISWDLGFMVLLCKSQTCAGIMPCWGSVYFNNTKATLVICYTGLWNLQFKSCHKLCMMQYVWCSQPVENIIMNGCLLSMSTIKCSSHRAVQVQWLPVIFGTTYWFFLKCKTAQNETGPGHNQK